MEGVVVSRQIIVSALVPTIRPVSETICFSIGSDQRRPRSTTSKPAMESAQFCFTTYTRFSDFGNNQF
ncbi:hypothetical protein [Lapidilactobacillus wuchangensis]|uniref:hypothetical protein n=1 Tax=Lapidilactobacillus wuchangensis TaxID=2486001 RepID=UPI0013DE2B9B|nr:hypothetical protein [Lapidilactobacillus wuchangensis]